MRPVSYLLLVSVSYLLLVSIPPHPPTWHDIKLISLSSLQVTTRRWRKLQRGSMQFAQTMVKSKWPSPPPPLLLMTPPPPPLENASSHRWTLLFLPRAFILDIHRSSWTLEQTVWYGVPFFSLVLCFLVLSCVVVIVFFLSKQNARSPRKILFMLSCLVTVLFPCICCLVLCFLVWCCLFCFLFDSQSPPSPTFPTKERVMRIGTSRPRGVYS
jgi:hypothetical protein